MQSQSPFLDVRSFAEEEAPARVDASPTRAQPASPFLAIYEFEGEGQVDPQTEEYVSFLNELYDEQFNETLSNLVDEAAGLYQANMNEQADPRMSGYEAERLLTQHFAPLAAETDSMILTVAAELDKRDPNTLSED